jgi:hypothetical protein
VRATKHRASAELVEVPLAEVRHPVPCRRCFKDFPVLKVWHPVCKQCGHTKPYPCRHNGGVLALVPGRGDFQQRRWMWPENAWSYPLVEPTFDE